MSIQSPSQLETGTDGFDKFRFTRECICPIIDYNYNLTEPVNYDRVLALDRKVREFVQADVGLAMSESNNPTLAMEMQTHASAHVKGHGMLYLFFLVSSLSSLHGRNSDTPTPPSLLLTRHDP
jgi:hypothetical protein